MKNAKLLIPAVAVLALSSAAAVTGTVAWFTANQQASVKGNGITLINTEGNLKVAVAENDSTHFGAAVSLTGQDATITHTALRDGSVNHANGSVFGAYLDETTGGVVSSGTEHFKSFGSADYKDGNATTIAGKNVFRANRYGLTFSMEAKSLHNATYGLFLDTTGGLTQDTESSDPVVQKDILKALRVAIVAKGTGGTTSEQVCVYAPYSKRTLAATTVGDTYVKSADAAAEQYIAAEIGDNNHRASSYSAEDANYLGDLSSEANTSGITVTVYTWLEGTDTACTNTNVNLLSDETYRINMKFHLIKK